MQFHSPLHGRESDPLSLIGHVEPLMVWELPPDPAHGVQRGNWLTSDHESGHYYNKSLSIPYMNIHSVVLICKWGWDSGGIITTNNKSLVLCRYLSSSAPFSHTQWAVSGAEIDTLSIKIPSNLGHFPPECDIDLQCIDWVRVMFNIKAVMPRWVSCTVHPEEACMADTSR